MNPIFAAALLLLFVTFHARGEAMLRLFNQSWAEVTEKIPEIAEAGVPKLIQHPRRSRSARKLLE